jgi:predicted membrane chloride channel (bestrophin family)
MVLCRAHERSTDRFRRRILGMPHSLILRSVTIPVAVVTAIACVVISIPPEWTAWIPVHNNSEPLMLTSTSLTFLLVFRCSISAGRFELARTLWGRQLHRTRDLTRQALMSFPPWDVHGKATLARWVCLLPELCTFHVTRGDACLPCCMLVGAAATSILTSVSRFGKLLTFRSISSAGARVHCSAAMSLPA